ncbi:hypothetical protein AAOE16_18215 [Ekhidna sp. MALMAid0563]|uniref:hypothetical protein n=1 Tax=Ekhidna sp. MALMAid0563 TaxID=3143937 RepID=UPI0032DEFC57
MKNIVILILLLSLFACDETDLYVESQNSKPSIAFVNGDQQSTTLTDSIKVSGLVGQFPLEFTLSLKDINENLEGVDLLNDSENRYLFIQYDSILVDLELVNIDPTTNTINMTALVFDEGTQNIKFIAYDKFNDTDTATLTLRGFENVKPVVRVDVGSDELSDFIRVIDLSSSYDQDSKYGGFIKSYHYLINGQSFVTTTDKLSYSFPERSTYGLSVFVTDNNNEVSQTRSFNVTIN